MEQDVRMTVEPERSLNHEWGGDTAKDGVHKMPGTQHLSRRPPILFSLPALHCKEESFEELRADEAPNHHVGEPQLGVGGRELNLAALDREFYPSLKMREDSETSMLQHGLEDDSSRTNSAHVNDTLKFSSHTSEITPVSEEATCLKVSEHTSGVESSEIALENEQVDRASEEPGEASSDHYDSIPAPSEVPAGRSWMETIGSHGVVIGLLLAVISAALLTGGKGPTSSQQQTDQLNFDEVAVDLPIPDQLYVDSAVGNADSNYSGTVSDSQLMESETTQSPLNNGGVSMANAEVPADTTLTPTESSPGTAESAVDLRTSDQGMVAENGNKQIDEGQMPSLEQLADAGRNASIDANDGTQGVMPEKTATPNRINDWLKYLPPVHVANEPAGAANSYNQ